MSDMNSSKKYDYCDDKTGSNDNGDDDDDDDIAADITGGGDDNGVNDNDDDFNVISPDDIIFSERDEIKSISKISPNIEKLFSKPNTQDCYPLQDSDIFPTDFPSAQDSNLSETVVPNSLSADITLEQPTAFIKATNKQVPTNKQPLHIQGGSGSHILQTCQVEEGKHYFNTDTSTAETEWDNCDVITLASNENKGEIYIEHGKGDVGLDPQQTQTPDFAFQEALQYFQSLDMSHLKDKIHTSVERKGLSVLSNFLFGPPKLSRNLLQSKEFVFCLAATTFDNQDQIHLKSLFAVYRNLTGRKMNCSRYGYHWEEIGFQGTDPSTDLRAVGLLGLLQLLYLTSKPQLNNLKDKMYSLSSHKTQHFPFCVMSLNATKMVLQALRTDRLNKLCNKQGDVITVVNEVFVATYFKIYHIWKYQHKTIVDSGFVLKDVETALKKNIPSLIKEVEQYIQNPNISQPSKCKQSSSSTSTSTKHDHFTGVSDLINNC
ncbi:ELMO domain-containing protein 3 isoform X1 [Octopus bimaculoides]|nr:ELMO domain-containing protein 3 isoform X1 [Octopus bimaculoides]|eukprot:XP_014783535.1 PREDICTED: ELMO domain-containing protein 3-like [Octopus bimaculoides]